MPKSATRGTEVYLDEEHLALADEIASAIGAPTTRGRSTAIRYALRFTAERMRAERPAASTRKSSAKRPPKARAR